MKKLRLGILYKGIWLGIGLVIREVILFFYRLVEVLI